jgi:Transposase DDE domain group 1
VVAHVGLHALGSFADRLGLGDALSARIPWHGAGVPIHDRGKVLVQMALTLAGGGESCLDIEHLRIGADLFGSVPSDTTVARTFHEIDASSRSAITEAMAEMRAEVWSRSSATTGTDAVLLDIDASLVEIHSENKEQTAPTFKGGFGFHPLFCFSDATGETLAALLRPGNAGSNTVADHVTVLDAAVAQLPRDIAVGHHDGDASDLVQRAVIMRADSAGCTEDFL